MMVKLRKKVVPLSCRKKIQISSSQNAALLHKQRNKQLQKNNKVLAVALQEARGELTMNQSLLQEKMKDNSSFMIAKMKLKEMAEMIQKLDANVNDVMEYFNESANDSLVVVPQNNCEEIRLRMRSPDVSDIKEASESERASSLDLSSSKKSSGRSLPKEDSASESSPVFTTTDLLNEKKDSIESDSTPPAPQFSDFRARSNDLKSTISKVPEKKASKPRENEFLGKKPATLLKNMKTRIPLLRSVLSPILSTSETKTPPNDNLISDNARALANRRKTFVVKKDESCDNVNIQKTNNLNRRETFVIAPSEANEIDNLLADRNYLSAIQNEGSAPSCPQTDALPEAHCVPNQTVLISVDMELTEVVPTRSIYKSQHCPPAANSNFSATDVLNRKAYSNFAAPGVQNGGTNSNSAVSNGQVYNAPPTKAVAKNVVAASTSVSKHASLGTLRDSASSADESIQTKRNVIHSDKSLQTSKKNKEKHGGTEPSTTIDSAQIGNRRKSIIHQAPKQKDTESKVVSKDEATRNADLNSSKRPRLINEEPNDVTSLSEISDPDFIIPKNSETRKQKKSLFKVPEVRKIALPKSKRKTISKRNSILTSICESEIQSEHVFSPDLTSSDSEIGEMQTRRKSIIKKPPIPVKNRPSISKASKRKSVQFDEAHIKQLHTLSSNDPLFPEVESEKTSPDSKNYIQKPHPKIRKSIRRKDSIAYGQFFESDAFAMNAGQDLPKIPDYAPRKMSNRKSLHPERKKAFVFTNNRSKSASAIGECSSSAQSDQDSLSDMPFPLPPTKKSTISNNALENNMHKQVVKNALKQKLIATISKSPKNQAPATKNNSSKTPENSKHKKVNKNASKQGLNATISKSPTHDTPTGKNHSSKSTLKTNEKGESTNLILNENATTASPISPDGDIPYSQPKKRLSLLKSYPGKKRKSVSAKSKRSQKRKSKNENFDDGANPSWKPLTSKQKKNRSELEEDSIDTDGNIHSPEIRHNEVAKDRQQKSKKTKRQTKKNIEVDSITEFEQAATMDTEESTLDLPEVLHSHKAGKPKSEDKALQSKGSSDKVKRSRQKKPSKSSKQAAALSDESPQKNSEPDPAQNGRSRRTKAPVSFKEPNLNKKLRRN